MTWYHEKLWRSNLKTSSMSYSDFILFYYLEISYFCKTTDAGNFRKQSISSKFGNRTKHSIIDKTAAYDIQCYELFSSALLPNHSHHQLYKSYLQFGFTWRRNCNEPDLQRVICKPSLLKRHLETKHAS